MTAPVEDEEEMTQLVDARFRRSDLVGKGANGIPRFLIAKQDQSAGLLEPQFVRDLIGKEAGPVPADTQEQVTMSGSPVAIAKLMQAGALSLATPDPEAVAKAKKSTKQINDLPDSAFAYIEPGGKKDAEGKTVPRSKRHFPVMDKAHADNAAARIAQGAEFGDKAKAKVEAAQRKFGEKVSKDALTPDPDDGVDGLDPTVPLAAPDDLDDCPGDPTDPGSPAWEAIDAATAQKWCSILARAQNALCLLSDREMLEAATGADPGDAESACDLADAASCLDYVIGELAVFAAGEQAETDLAAEAVGKAAAAAEAPVQVIESLSAIKKAGRVLSAANEGKIRQAAQSLSEVLASLPQAPDGGQGAAPVIKEGTMPEDQNGTVAKDAAPASPDAQARDTGPVNAGGTTGLGQPRVTGPDSALPADGPQQALPGDPPGRQVIKEAKPRKGRHKVARGLPVALYGPGRVLLGVAPAKAVVRKADAPAADGTAATMQAVFDQDGNLVGVVDPADITPVAGTDSKPEPAAEPAADPAADPGDMAPQPAADAGTPAGGVTKAADADQDATPENVAKSGDGTTSDEITMRREVLKSTVEEAVTSALERQSAAHQEVVAKMAADKVELAKQVEALEGRLETVEKQPAMPAVFANGATPPPGAVPPPRAALRGQDAGAEVDVAKAAEMKAVLYKGSAPEQAKAFHQMEEMAIAQLAAIRAGGPARSPAAAAS